MPDMTTPCTNGRHEGNYHEQRRVSSEGEVFYIIRCEAVLVSELTCTISKLSFAVCTAYLLAINVLVPPEFPPLEHAWLL